MKTGNTAPSAASPRHKSTASMEPGHEDREYQLVADQVGLAQRASMEPGHEDREYSSQTLAAATGQPSLNGARS